MVSGLGSRQNRVMSNDVATLSRPTGLPEMFMKCYRIRMVSQNESWSVCPFRLIIPPSVG